jgi:hypothetical protein
MYKQMERESFAMNILALDLGTASEFSVLKEGEIIYGTKKLQNNKNVSEVRFLYFCNPVCTIKKIATGNGHASKKDMITFAKSCGFNLVDDNYADALAVLFVGLNILKNKENFRYCFAKETSGSLTPEAFLASELFRRLTPIDSGRENKE